MNDIERALARGKATNGRGSEQNPRGSTAPANRRVIARRETASPIFEPAGGSVEPEDRAPTTSNAPTRTASPTRERAQDGRRSRQIALPLDRLDAAGYLVPGTPKGVLTEQYRHIKRPLLANCRQDGLAQANIVMVTSSIPGEGKTYTAVNLAMSLALERDLTVLLIDADVIKRSASLLLCGQHTSPGLLDLIDADPPDVSAAIRRTDVPDLRVMPAGTPSEQGTELLSSRAMAVLMQELSERYPDRLIVLDCPPMLAANEAGAVIDYVGQVVFVVDEGRTAQSDVDAALARFPTDRFVGILMNKSRARLAKAYRYGYG